MGIKRLRTNNRMYIIAPPPPPLRGHLSEIRFCAEKTWLVKKSLPEDWHFTGSFLGVTDRNSEGSLCCAADRCNAGHRSAPTLLLVLLLLLGHALVPAPSRGGGPVQSPNNLYDTTLFIKRVLHTFMYYYKYNILVLNKCLSISFIYLVLQIFLVF